MEISLDTIALVEAVYHLQEKGPNLEDLDGVEHPTLRMESTPHVRL